MEDVADHLVHDVLPRVPFRQWVLSFPRRLRFLAARDPRVASRLLDLFTRTIFAWQRRSARRLGVAEPRTAGVTAVQRFGSAINLNVHFHTLVPDGVFDLSGPGPARFVPLRSPTDEEVVRLLTAVIRKVARAGLLDEEGASDDEPWPRSRQPRSSGGFASPIPSSTPAGPPIWTASRSTPASASTRTTGRG